MGKGTKNSDSSLSVDNQQQASSMTGQASSKLNCDGKMRYTWDEIRRHTTKNDRWLVINKHVYNVTNWVKHPGGLPVLNHYAGQDATEAFTSFHPDSTSVQKYLKAFHIGDVIENEQQEQTEIRSENEALKQEFQKLKEIAISKNLFQPSWFFFTVAALHILVLEFIAYFIIFRYGISWIPYLAAVLIYTAAEIQCGWIQHDFGHLSVFKKSSWNHLLHQIYMGFLKGASADWWNHMHFQHHSKPNVIDKDPDTRIETLFLLGDKMPLRIAQKNAKHGKTLPYNFQHLYFFIVAPLLFPIYFQMMTFRHIYTRRRWMDLLSSGLFYLKFFTLMSLKLGVFGAFKFHFLMRVIEGTWFVLVAQSNHVVMDVSPDDSKLSWFHMQLKATCNIEKSWFNDWFTGHLNFQIEHHLFPMMPRHNLYKIQPEVMEICRKYNIPYIIKPLGRAFIDILMSLEKSGRMWLDAYEEIVHSVHSKTD